MEQQQQLPATAEKSQSPPATTTQTFDKGRITAIFTKSFDEWTEDEAAYIIAYEEEERRKEEERKQKEAERKAESERKSREYWARIRAEEEADAQAAQGGTMEWFISQAMQKQAARPQPRITNHADKTPQYLAMAYKMEVERWGGTLQLDEYTQRAISDVSRWAVQHRKPGLLLRGYVGVGKTTMLFALARVFEVVERQTIRIVDARKITTLAKDSRTIFEELAKKPMLGIDDLGTEPLTVKSYGNDLTPVVELLTERYNKRLFTVITTNLAKKIVDGREVDELQEIYGDRLFDRFREMFNTISYDANQKSYRQ